MKSIKKTIWTAAGLLGLVAIFALPAAADQQILDDLIVDGSLCVGQDCVNGESFGFDTLRLKENNLRIKAQDTSNTASFPTQDWQLTFNDSTNGGQNKFAVDCVSPGSSTPFTIEGCAPSHSLYVDDGGRIGFGTNAPVADLHVKSGNTPTLRLEQDGSSGFTAQTWDLAGNEANFFLRDASNGSTLVFRVDPSAPTNALFIDGGTGDIGMGTNQPEEELEIISGAADDVIVELESSNASAQNTGFRFRNAVRTFSVFNNNNGDLQFNVGGGLGTVLSIDGATGDVSIPEGNCSDEAGGGGCTPDYVFEPGYELLSLEELGEFIAENKHLPNVPSAADNAKNGISIRGLNFAMLEKIEELVLYTLDQQSTIDRLATDNAALIERLEKLEAALAAD